MESLITKYWPQIVTLFGGIVWLSRLENKVKNNECDIASLKNDSKAEMDKILLKLDLLSEQMTKVSLAIAGWEGYMKRTKEEHKP